MPTKKKSPSTKSAKSKKSRKKDNSTKAEGKVKAKAARSDPKLSEDAFPIVGIGASAGGVQALENFFAHMPSDCKMAFVIVQHLDPHHKSMMDSLLAKETRMQINDGIDGVRVKAGQIYLKPPGKDVIIRNQTLRLQEAKEKEGTRLPIDTFFRSLATDQKEKAICVVLSGASHDGTLGAKLVKGEGGLVVVQDGKQAVEAVRDGDFDLVLQKHQPLGLPGAAALYATPLFGQRRGGNAGRKIRKRHPEHSDDGADPHRT